MGCLKGRKARQQPSDSKGRINLQHDTAVALFAKLVDRLTDTAEGTFHRLSQLAPLAGQFETAASAKGQATAKLLLKLPNLVTDSGRRDVQFLRRAFEALQASHGLKRPKCFQGRQIMHGTDR
ncbi:hypothetical protein HY29_17290 [Hyphomonas beringensis]|uniref:Uncharacterized protein n=1 Tax=Hyphomonas beringensis TaxID=1280946 RepID=A0A062U673_9PROT|nr:hypothetical protein HY29_17290 [Hyphomonas beringensis]